MIRTIAVIVATLFLFVSLAWVTMAASPQASPSSSLQQMANAPVDYTLAYPGPILPDNFLYPIKALRDRIVSFFITDARKQAEFDLLQADKRLAASEEMLQESKPNTKVISETLSKGENYFGDAIQNIQLAKSQGRLIGDFLDTLTKSGLKHEQVLAKMSNQTQGQLQQNILADIKRVQGFENQVGKLTLQK